MENENMENENILKELEKALADKDCELAEQIVSEYKEDFDGDLAEVAFRMAVQKGCYDYVNDTYDDIELNDVDGCSSSYLYETQDKDMSELLFFRRCMSGLGWECTFEGSSWKLETTGVYCIE